MSASRMPEDSLRDPALDAAWAAHSTELPPPRVEAAILAAAHREVGTRPQALAADDDGSTHGRRPARAWWGLAAAATIGAIAFGIVQVAPPPIQTSDPMVASDTPASSSSASSGATQREAAPAQRAEAVPEVTTPAPATPSPAEDRAALSRPDTTPSAAQEPRVRSKSEIPRKVARADGAATETAAPIPAEGSTTAKARDQAQRSAGDPRALPQPQAFAVPGRPSGEPPVAATAPPPPAPSIASPRPFPASPPLVAESGGIPGGQLPADAAKSETTNAFAARRSVPDERAAAMAAPQAGVARGLQQRDADSQSLAKMRALTPEAWVERIRMLHAQQRLDEAARELNAFRDAYPDADGRLPEPLRQWAASVARAR
jgi:hypothetical protein